MDMKTSSLARSTAPSALRRVGADPLRQSMEHLAHLLPGRADAIVLMDFLEDDLREGLDALSDVESHFSALLAALRPGAVCPGGLLEAGDDLLVQKRLELLSDVVMRLRRRTSQAAGLLRQPPTT